MKKCKQAAFLLLGFGFILAALPASADTLYSNTNFSSNSWVGQSIGTVDQSFTITQDSTVTGVNFSAITEDTQMQMPPICFTTPTGTTCTTMPPTEVSQSVTSLQWKITDLSSDTLASGSTYSISSSALAYGSTDSVFLESFNIPSLHLGAGTYYLQLSGAMAGASPGASWESINSSASGPYGLQVLGTEDAPATSTPEPSSFLLLGSGLAGLAGLLKRKLTA